jgi:penicillin-binding protein 1C
MLKQFLKTVYPTIHTLSLIKVPRPPKSFPIVILILTFIFTFSILTYKFIYQDLPSPSSLTSQPIPLTTHIRDRNGQELYKIYSNQNRTLIKLSDLPDYIKQAVISIEDKDFYHHRGFSITGTLRAAWRIFTNQRVEGGSTITQQLVKTSLLSPERTIQRKLKELVLSLSVESLFSKDQILEMYLNRVSFGGSAYGIEEAAETYFGKKAADLDLAQATLLAGLPASPTTYSPFGSHPELAKSRQKEVLRRMVANGYIDWDQAEQASGQELIFHSPDGEILAPHFVMYIKDLLAQKYGADIVEQGGLDVTTSLDLSIQQMAQHVVSEEIAKIKYLHIQNGAALVTKPNTGEILAMIGSTDYFDIAGDGNVNVTLSPRQPGSSIKPINYSLAFSRGFNPSSIIDDSPITYTSPGQPPYSPINYDNRYHGRVTLRTALGSSYNIPAVKLLSANGVTAMIDLAQKMGITTWADRSRFGLSLTLGGGEVTMTDMNVVYGVFANGGFRVDLHPILSVRDSKGRILEEFRCKSTSTLPLFHSPALAIDASATEVTSCPSEQVLTPSIAFLITDILADNVARTPAFGPNSLLKIPGSTVAVKTGTTNNLRDNWTIGYTPKYVVSTWVGNNDSSPMSYVASGITGASPIWNRIITNLLKNQPDTPFTPPPGIIKVNICTITGQLSCNNCPTKSEYFIDGTQPKTACTEDQIRQILEKKPDNNRDKILEGVSNWR